METESIVLPAFHVDKVYYLARHDLLVLSGGFEGGPVDHTWWIDLPESIEGPGFVPISGVQPVAFAGGVEKLCVLLDYAVIQDHQKMEFSDLEGQVLRVQQEA